MARKHSPGCYCCLGCDCGEVTPPTITISGYTASTGWQSVSDCCKYIIYEPDDLVSTECCATLHEKTWDQTCEIKAWARNLPPGIDAPGICPPDPSKFCTPDPPLTHIGTLTLTYFENQKIFFRIQYDKPTITLFFGRDNFTCDGVTECKWFLKARWCFTVNVYYEYGYAWRATRTSEAVHPCFFATQEYDGEKESPNYPANECDTTNPPCSEDQYGVCFDRIKIWDELPSDGAVNFNDEDIGSDCEASPFCAAMEFTESEYCFESVASFGNCELCWDYEIINDTVTYEFGGNVISSYTSFTGCDFECLPSITSCAGNATTCPIVTQTLPCQSVEYGFSDACCGTSYNHADTDPFFGVSGRCAVLAGNPELGLEPCAFFRDPVPVPYFARDSSCEIPCESTCCHFFDCGDCSTCTDKFSIGYGSQEITIETTCGPVSGGQCCISLGPRTVNVVWA